MDSILVFFVGFPNNPNLDVSGHFGCNFFLWLPLSAKVVSIYRLTGSRELRLHCYHCQTLLVCLNRGTSKELKYCNDCNGRKYSDITVHLGGHECKSRCEDSSTEREIARHDIHFHPSWRGKTKTGYDLGKEAITYKRGCKYFVIYLRSRPVDPDVVC